MWTPSLCISRAQASLHDRPSPRVCHCPNMCLMSLFWMPFQKWQKWPSLPIIIRFFQSLFSFKFLYFCFWIVHFIYFLVLLLYIPLFDPCHSLLIHCRWYFNILGPVITQFGSLSFVHSGLKLPFLTQQCSCFTIAISTYILHV